MKLKQLLWLGMGYIWEDAEFMEKFCADCPKRCAYGEPAPGCFRIGTYNEIQGVLHEAAEKCVCILTRYGVPDEDGD